MPRAALVVLAVLLAAPRAPDASLTDTLQIVVLRREVAALDSRGAGPRVSLERGERVLWYGARGRVGIALTGRRVLAAAVGSASWQESRYRLREDPPAGALLGERVALVLTETRAIGFDGTTGNLVERTLGPGERVLATGIAENVGVVVTGRRALGVSPFAGGFFETPLHVGEDLVGVEATGDLATVRTSRRLLSFRGPSGLWVEESLELR